MMEIKITAVKKSDRITNTKLLESDAVEYIGRENCLALLAEERENGEEKGNLVAQLIQVDSGAKETEILYFEAESFEYAKELIRTLNENMINSGTSRIVYEFIHADEMLRRAFLDNGYRVSEGESFQIALTSRDIKNSSIYNTTPPSYVLSLRKLDKTEIWQGLTNCIINEKKGYLEDITTIPESWFDPDISCCCKKGDRIDGMFLVHMNSSGVLIPELLYSNAENYKDDLKYMVSYSGRTFYTHRSAFRGIMVNCHKSFVKKLVGGLFHDIRPKQVEIAEYRTFSD